MVCRKYTDYAIPIPHNTDYVEKTEKGRRKDGERIGFSMMYKPRFYALYSLFMQ